MGRLISAAAHSALAPLSGWRVIHWMATAVLAWMGFVLLLPGLTFGTNPAYSVFVQLGSEEQWALFYILGAVIGVWGGLTQNWKVKVASGMLLSMTHGIIGTLLFFGSALSTGSGTYLIIAFAVTLRLWRLVKVNVT
jgi:hypothetical protein